MVRRTYCIEKVERAWIRRSLLWLSGVRRVGKTFLCHSLDKIEYFDCELPSSRRQMEDPEAFLQGLWGRRIVLDEVHRLSNPAEILKIASDHFPDIKVLTTGSSTLQTSAKFRDALTGRKMELWLTPMMSEDLKNTNLQYRFLHGGLPPFFLSKELIERDFQERIDSCWAKDITRTLPIGTATFLARSFWNSSL